MNEKISEASSKTKEFNDLKVKFDLQKQIFGDRIRQLKLDKNKLQSKLNAAQATIKMLDPNGTGQKILNHAHLFETKELEKLNKKVVAISKENKEQMDVISMLQTRNDNLEVETKQIDILMQRVTDLGAKNHEQAEHIKQLVKQIELRDTRDVHEKTKKVTRNLSGFRSKEKENFDSNETENFNTLWKQRMEEDTPTRSIPVSRVISGYFPEESRTNKRLVSIQSFLFLTVVGSDEENDKKVQKRRSETIPERPIELSPKRIKEIAR